MNLFLNKSILLFILFLTYNVCEDITCPSRCTCKRLTQRDETYIKFRCGDEKTKINFLEEIQFDSIAKEIVHFNLSNNFLSTFYPKVQLFSVQKLDLSRNHLTHLQNNQFEELPNLRRLDLSANVIKNIELLTFTNLSNLERLKLNQNQIASIELGTFDPLISLKQLDISNNPLTCDCGLLWLLDWSQKHSVKLVSNPTCDSPPSFKSLPLRKIKIGVDINCASPALHSGIAIVEMRPKLNQVVFEGDKVSLQCSAPSISHDSSISSKIEWTWLDSDPKLYFNDISIETHFLQSTGFLSSTLRIPKLNRNHTGIWNCHLISRQGNYSKGITIVVISEDTQYCPLITTSSNKGTYTWPRTVVNYTATISCESVNLNYEISAQKATYYCSDSGQWENLNTTLCSYISETTKILEQFSKVNRSIMESAKHFKNYTSDLNHFKDVMDVVFAVETMQNYIKHLSINQIGGVLIDVTNNLLDLPKEYLQKANYDYHISSILLEITEKLAGISSTSLLHKSNIATEIFPLKKNGFSGLKCTWYVDLKTSTDRLFHCITNSQVDTTEMHGRVSEASITIPETLFEQLEEQNYDLSEKTYKMLIAMQTNSNFFPIEESEKHKIEVTTSVVGAKLVTFPVVNLTDPIYVMLKTPQSSQLSSFPLTPVWWNPNLNNGTGSWSSDGCHFSHEYQENIVFFCHNFGYYGLMQDISHLESAKAGAKFKLSHPAIYVGSFILFTSLLVAIMTYLLCYPSIQMPKKAKHALINLWIAICFLCFFYVFGIYQTEVLKLCQIVGMLLHYFTLSSLLWICVGVNCMYKRLSKSDIMELQDDELPSDEPIKKPILGLYFVGWGVAIIVCGISAAINIREYASPNYCFLRMGPPLSALYIPFTILLIFLGIFFLLIRCAIYSTDSNGHLSEGTQATENVDLDLLEPNFPNTDSRSVLTASSKTASSEVEDSEHLPSAQLKAYIIFLCIYVMAWMSCALATTEPYQLFSFESDLFSIAYAILATILSAFTLFFYCIARSDVRGQWVLLNRWLKRKQFCFRSRNISDTIQNNPQVQPLPIPPVSNSLVGDLQVLSRSSSRSSSRTKSNSHNSNNLKASDLNGASYSDSHGTKINNVNLVVLHRQQYRSNVIPNIIENPTNAAEVFYNPHQSIVARKFFKRQKRHMMKRNNLVARARDSDSASVMSDIKQIKDNSSIDQSIFGTNSKVNNTNIHVEHVKKQQKNPNIFSDSAEEYDSSCLPMHNIVLNAEQLRRRENTKHKNRKKTNSSSHTITPTIENTMRSVSQQCTLEYSSENISDSILEKPSPEKNSPICEDAAGTAAPLDFNEFDVFGNKFGEVDDGGQFDVSEVNLSDMQSRVSLGDSGDPIARIYVNPAHDLHVQKGVQSSRASSVSVSDLDELYQQIRRGPNEIHPPIRSILNSYGLTRNSPCFSDSDINSCDQRIQGDCSNISNLSDNVETTV